MLPPQGGWAAIPKPFFAGMLLAVVGGALVTLYKPAPAKPHAPAARSPKVPLPSGPRAVDGIAGEEQIVLTSNGPQPGGLVVDNG